MINYNNSEKHIKRGMISLKQRTVVLDKAYDIFIEDELIKKVGEYVKKIAKGQKCAIISDSNVFPIYGGWVEKSLAENGFEVSSFTFEAGELSKNLGTIEKIYTFLAKSLISRSDTVIALGGGVCGDMAGFAAATYLRGINFVQIPTTLLSQVDSSVGGKTAVDLPFGKNLVGAFHQPILVLIDPKTLDTLPKRYFADGMGEVIKTAAIKSDLMFEKIELCDMKDILADVIFECVCIKANIVEEDEKEQNVRKLLNFGHTMGHAIEICLNYDIMSHGEAVSVGMMLMTKATEASGLTKKGSAKRLFDVLTKNGLPTETDISLEKMCEKILYDKKYTGEAVDAVIISDIGESKILTVRPKNLYAMINEGRKLFE